MIETTIENGILIVDVTVKKLDMHVASDFQHAFSDLISGGGRMVLMDLSQVVFMDSSGLAAFVFCFQATRLKRELAMCNVQERVLQLFKLTRIDQYIRMYTTRAEALNALNSDEATP